MRETRVYAKSELLDLAEAPIETPVGNCAGVDPREIELDAVFDGLEAGRWLIVSGVRNDAAVPFSEVVLLAGVRQTFSPSLAGDMVHTTITIAPGLSFCYRRSSVRISANVAHATHGETQKQVLGSGDGSPAQEFSLSRSPLTYLSAPTPSGVQTTLEVRVNDVRWHEADTLCGHAGTERIYATSIDDASQTTIQFGNGVEGSRLPGGSENVRAVYRAGLGKGGNLRAAQLSILSAPPLGVTSVSNPLATTGGADSETRDQARRNAPLAVLSLDRLVSLRDYADFARTYAGIAKASAVRASAAKVNNGHGAMVDVVVAGLDDIPIAPDSDLLQNLARSLRDFGDPQQPVQVRERELLLLFISADVALQPDYAWEFVEPKIRAAMLDAFGFERREIGQDVLRSDVQAVMHRTPGVAYVRVNLLGGIPGTLDAAGIQATIARLDARPRLPVSPSQIAYLSANVAESLILNPIQGEETL